MRFVVRDMTGSDARAIAAWRYEPPYDVYDWGEDPEDLAELLDPAGWGETWFAVDDAATGELVGFAELTRRGDLVEIGLGMRPDTTGLGLGAPFTEALLAFARARWAPARFALDVLPWNERAMRAYERAGFVRGERYVRRIGSGTEREFVRMDRASVQPRTGS
jgi:ribosomal-protein-alanine N-acetyltransferase